MIGRLTGVIVEKQPPFVLLEVNGVGYDLQCSMQTLYELPQDGSPVTVYTQLIIREDAHLLFGFSKKTERELFRELIKVNGVGPKLALSILSSMAVSTFIACVQQQNTSTLVKIPGVGKKTAERLIIEMRDRLKTLNPHLQSHFSQQMPDDILLPQQAIQDAIAALITLGYKPQAASKVMDLIPNKENLSSEILIRTALQQIAV